MSDLVFRTTSTDRTIFEAVIVEARKRHGIGRVAIEDPVSGKLTYRAPPRRRRRPRTEALPLAPRAAAVGVMLPNANGAAVTILGLMSAGRVPAMINFTAGLGQHPRRLHARPR